MKKTTILVAAITVSFLSASVMHAQETTFTTPKKKARDRNAPVHLAPRLDGVVVRAVRSGHPLQMINPGAPAEYGSGQEVVRREPDDPYQRPQGIKLFAVEF